MPNENVVMKITFIIWKIYTLMANETMSHIVFLMDTNKLIVYFGVLCFR